MPSHDRASSGTNWALWLISLLLGACTTLALDEGTTYPPGWQKTLGAGPECDGVVGTFENKGEFVDKAGKTSEAFLTSLLPFDLERAPNIKARDAMRSCERVSLRIESTPWRAVIGPDVKHWKLVLTPARAIGTQPTMASDPCIEYRLPDGRGYPFDSQLLPVCIGNIFALQELPAQLGYSCQKLTVDSDGALIIKLESGPVALSHVGWARFRRLP